MKVEDTQDIEITKVKGVTKMIARQLKKLYGIQYVHEFVKLSIDQLSELNMVAKENASRMIFSGEKLLAAAKKPKVEHPINILEISGIGKKVARQLKSVYDVNFVHDLVELDVDQLTSLKLIRKEKAIQMIIRAKRLLRTDLPELKDRIKILEVNEINKKTA